MGVTLLSDVQAGVYTYETCVRISRIWEFHGKNDEESIKHLDLVVIDEKGTPMYVEIPPDVVPILRPHLAEGKIIYMKKISIERAKPSYKPVRSPYMIKLNKRTQLMELTDQPRNFPKYTFYLTPFADQGSTPFLSGTAACRWYINLGEIPEIAGLVGHKITVVVKVIPGQSIKPENDDPTFDILNIRKRHGKDSMLWTFNNEQTPAVLPTSFPQPANLPPLVPIETKKEGNQSSSSHKYASQHIQYMDIDQTGILDDTNMSNKRTFQGNDDSDKEISDDSDSNSTMLKKGKRERT